MDKRLYMIDLVEFVRTHVDELLADEQDLTYFNELYGSYAISKAEDSTLTLQEAKDTARLDFSALSQSEHTISQQVARLDISDKNYQKKLKKLHDKLEFSNILQLFRYINDPEYLRERTGLSIDRLCDIHYRLTKDMDNIFEDILDAYEPYFPGILRAKDNIAIWKYTPMKAEVIEHELSVLFLEGNSIKRVDDIFRLHAWMYHIHPFSNGNKRICRIVEIMLLKKLGIDTTIIPPSLGYYRQQGRYIKRLLETSLKRKDYDRFVPFAYGSLLLGVLYLLHREIKRRRKKILDQYEGLRILATLQEGERVTTKRLQNHKDLKRIPRRTFFEILEKELTQVGDIVLREKEGRNVYYSLHIQDSTYQAIKAKFIEIVAIYKDENPGYHSISFLRRR